MDIRSGQVVLLYLFEVAETVDLSSVPAAIGGPTVAARLKPKPATPAYVQYDNPPLSFHGDVVHIGTLEGFDVRFRVYDYGVLSVALSRTMSGGWADFAALGQQLIENDHLEAHAERACQTVAERLRPALTDPHAVRLSEDYAVFIVHELKPPSSASAVLDAHGIEIATTLRGERQPLSEQERATVLQHRISYLDDDLVVPTWNAAFVYDTPSGAKAAIDIMEFANSQLLQFRYYDERLDRELTSIYASLQRPRWFDQWIGSRYAREARRVQALFVDVAELTDRTVNALKFTGDPYAARLFGLVGSRLGLETWKSDVEAKLQTLDAVYRFAVEQSSMARGQLLELLIVLILVFELVMFFAGLRA